MFSQPLVTCCISISDAHNAMCIVLMIIPVRRSRLSGYQETSSPAKREPHRFFIVRRSRQGCYPYRSVGYQCLLRQRWIQSIDFSHGDVPIQVEALNRDLV